MSLLILQYLKGRNFCGTNFRGINFRDFAHKSRKYVPPNLQNIEQLRKFVLQNFMIFQFKKQTSLNHQQIRKISRIGYFSYLN